MLDLNNDYENAGKKINSLKTVKENKKKELQQKKTKVSKSLDKKKSDVTKQLNELKSKGTKSQEKAKELKKHVKSEVKNQLEQLLDLFKQSLPSSPKLGGSNSMSALSLIFLETALKTKDEVKNILVDEIISTIGCSEEQNVKTNEPIYIKVSQIDLFKILTHSPDDPDMKYYYEKDATPPGQIPNAMNRNLYERLQNLNQSYNTQYGSQYKGASGSELFDFEYVQYYPAINPTNFGDFIKVTLKPQLNNLNSISSFLFDYFQSIDVIDFNVFSAELMNGLTGAFDFSLKKGTDELTDLQKFFMVVKRLMGICSDPNKKIDVAGTAKLSDLDNIDDSFFEVTDQELRQIQNSVNNISSGVIEFEDCDNVKFPINPQAVKNGLDEVISENVGSKKVGLLKDLIDNLQKDPKWQNIVFPPSFDLKLNFENNIITQLPKIIFKAILSPKVLLGLMIAVKSVSNTINDAFDDIMGFIRAFKKFVVGFVRKIVAIFVKILFDTLKKNIKLLVEGILTDIMKEAKNKQLAMYASIVYILMVVGQGIIDYRNCKSVIDEILKLLNLGLSQLNLGLPLFVLSGAKFLGGVSDTRAFANAIENLQELGLPTGDAPDGGPNMMNMAMMSMIKGQNKEQAENGKTEIAIPPLTVVVPPLGAGPGITLPSKGYGKSY